jgi:hypothetical protein
VEQCSASAFFVTQTLRGLARDGRTVIASVHQPSSEVFQLFDSLYLLSGGKTVYFGKASEACQVVYLRLLISLSRFCVAYRISESCGILFILQFFAQAGFPCPPLRNPSDHFLRCVNSDFDKVKATLKGSMKTRVSLKEFNQLPCAPCLCWFNCFDRAFTLLVHTQFERTDDPLERTTTSEVMRRLISYYQHSQYYFNAQQKVDEMARVVST